MKQEAIDGVALEQWNTAHCLEGQMSDVQVFVEAGSELRTASTCLLSPMSRTSSGGTDREGLAVLRYANA
jgi:hypothetical protein